MTCFNNVKTVQSARKVFHPHAKRIKSREYFVFLIDFWYLLCTWRDSNIVWFQKEYD